MTVLEVIQRSSDFLAQKGVESPRLQIELLLAHVLQMKRLHLYLNFERVLTPEQLGTLRGYVKRRSQREPLQHILGSTSFCGLEIKVTPQVLVPRPETEQLAEKAWQFLQQFKGAQPTALDFGTGSGCIAIALAVHAPAAAIHALDLSEAALVMARENTAAHTVQERIQFHLGAGFNALPAGLRFDLIVANPPYIPTDEIAQLDPEVRDFDPHLALDGGPDGLNPYRELAAQGHERLLPEGRIIMEFGDGQADALQEVFENEKWVVEALDADYSGRPRILTVRPAST